jgi:hypothetical protein
MTYWQNWDIHLTGLKVSDYFQKYYSVWYIIIDVKCSYMIFLPILTFVTANLIVIHKVITYEQKWLK